MTIEEDTLMITYDDSIGIVYCPQKVAISTTTPKHAQTIKKIYEKYIKDELVERERLAFEDYIETSFRNKPNLPIASYPNLLERRELGRLEIMLANDCNLNCRYCYAHAGQYGKLPQIMTPEVAITYLSKLVLGQYDNVSIVMLFGGEPTLAPETIHVICRFFEENVTKGHLRSMPIFTMVTNGTLITDQLVKTIKRYNIQVTISIDGPMEINDQLRVDKLGNGTFLKIEQGIKKLQAAGCPPRMIEATYTKLHKLLGYEKKHISDYLKHYFNVDKILVANCSGNSDNDALAYSDDMSGCQAAVEVNPAATISLHRDLTRNLYYDISCSAGINSIALLPSGAIYPCHFFAEHDKFQIANYRDGCFDFSNYSNVVHLLEPAHKLKNKRCEKCWAKSLCVLCPAGLLLYSEDTNQACDAERLRLSALLLHFAKEHIGS